MGKMIEDIREASGVPDAVYILLAGLFIESFIETTVARRKVRNCHTIWNIHEHTHQKTGQCDTVDVLSVMERPVVDEHRAVSVGDGLVLWEPPCEAVRNSASVDACGAPSNHHLGGIRSK